jgi:hypothetical protein
MKKIAKRLLRPAYEAVSTITHIHGASATSFDGWC